jgi:hypothetical protein
LSKDALAQLDGLFEWMEFKIKSTTKVCLATCQVKNELTAGQVPNILLYPVGRNKRYQDFGGTVPLPQIRLETARYGHEIDWRKSFFVLHKFA